MYLKRKSLPIIIIGLFIVLGCFSVVYFINSRHSSQSKETKQDELLSTSSSDEIDMRVPSSLSLPTTITGKVRGTWFFEGSFPVFLKNDQGNVISIGLAKSSENWMTSEMIPFQVTLPAYNYTGKGVLLFKKDNPSDDKSLERAYEVPVVIK